MTTPLPPFTVGAANYIEALADRKRKQTLEVIQAVRSDGWVRVVNTWVPVTGKVQLLAGQTVAVMWKDGKPQVAMMNQARRGGGDLPMAPPEAGVVEMLWVAARPDGVLDVWFRNADQCVPLEVDRFGITPNTDVVWGPGNDRFLVTSGNALPILGPITLRHHILKFAREPHTPFQAGEAVAGSLSLERTENIFASTLTLATLSGAVISGSSPVGTAVYFNPVFSETANQTVAASLQQSLLDDEGNLVLVWQIQITGTAKGLAQGPPGIVRKFDFVGIDWRHTVIADNTRSRILLDAFTTPALVGPLAGATAPGAVNFADFAGAITESADVFYAPGAFPTRQFIHIFPILVTAAAGVRGWVAEVVQQFQCSAVTNGGVPLTCTAVLGTSQFAARAGAMVQPPSHGAIVLLPMAGTFGVSETGTAYEATLAHIFYRRTLVSGFFPSLDAGGSDSAGFGTRFDTGETVQVSETLRAVGQRGMHLLLTDFVYLADDARVDQPATAPAKFFMNAWTFGGAVTLRGATATSSLPRDASMDAAAILADIPASVTRPKDGSGREAAIQIVNSRDILSPLGRFVEVS